jgi:hypothetical protein
MFLPDEPRHTKEQAEAQFLAQCTYLTDLTYDPPVTRELIWQTIDNIPSLRRLELSLDHKLTDSEGYSIHFSANLRGLKIVRLQGCSPIISEFLKRSVELPNVRDLEMYLQNNEGSSLPVVLGIRTVFPFIRRLTLGCRLHSRASSGNPGERDNMSDVGFAWNDIDPFPGLTSVTIWCNDKSVDFRDEDANAVSRACPHLEYLSLSSEFRQPLL